MRVGIVCPYSFAVPGGVQGHITGLARMLLAQGHHVSVLAPGESDVDLPRFVQPSGRAVGVPFNGSVARVQFGPMAYARVRRWIAAGDFDVLHLHEPVVPSLSMMALMVADGPVVATFHLNTRRSRTMSGLRPLLRPLLEKVTARIAVSASARRVQVEHLGGDAVQIPNGVDLPLYASASPLDGASRDGCTIGFVGRFDEPRKGMGVLLSALRLLKPVFPRVRLLVAGDGQADALYAAAGPELAPHVELLGRLSDAMKARAFASMDVFCAPNLGGESFGMVLTEAMAASVPIVASSLEEFRHVLDDGAAGVLTAPGDAVALADALAALVSDRPRREELARAGSARVSAFDWARVGEQVLRVYDAAIAADPRQVTAVAGERL